MNERERRIQRAIATAMAKLDGNAQTEVKDRKALAATDAVDAAIAAGRPTPVRPNTADQA